MPLKLPAPVRPNPSDRGPSPIFVAARHHGPACFAPPLDEPRLLSYEQLAAAAPPPVKEAMDALIAMARKFRETPESKLPGEPLETEYTRNPFRDADGKPVPPPKQVPLEAAEIDRIWDAVPWQHELAAMDALFETIDNATQNPLRDAAFHLLWYAKELYLDREPLTADKVGR